MPDIDDVLADAQREIKSVGALAEDAPKSLMASEQFKKDMEALTAGALKPRPTGWTISTESSTIGRARFHQPTDVSPPRSE